MPQIRSYPQATTLQTTDAFVIDRIGSGTEYIEATNFIPTTLIWTGSMFYEGSSPPAASQLIGGWSLPVKVTFPADNTAALALGWGFHIESTTLPTSSFVITLALNDVLAATVTVATDGTYTYASSGGVAWVANIRDRVTAIAPASPDATANNFFLTMAGTLTS